MLLQPRKFKHKSRQKGRSVKSWKSGKLTYGDCGLLTLQPLRMSAKQIFRLKVFLKKAIKKPEYTKRLIWFNTFPHLPLTKKPKGMRMGKGAGKLNSWAIQMRSGLFVFEFKNLRLGRAVHFFNKIQTKIPTKTLVKFIHNKYLRLESTRSTNVRLTNYW